ncbi:MAG: glycyl-radical enzyme activating protein [Ruminococcaceae bacterium]|nr:glycyl-radical enzyme activating protein [Oscillospiraceae bacterium]
MKGMIFDIQRSSFVDGPGIRTTVFFKGCNLRCAWCHNPESQLHAPQLLFYKDKCKGCGKCLEKCPNKLEKCELCGKCELYCMAEARRLCGKEYTAEELLPEILADKLFFETSGGGVTFSGGECMLQLDFLCEILKKCKENGIQTAVDTAGHVPYTAFERVLPYTDIFLYDVKMMDGEKHKAYVGADNALILKNLAKLLQTGKRIWIRVPVIGGVNDTEEEMLAIRAFFEKHGQPEKIELLPYHAMGESKALAMGKTQQRFAVPEKEKIERLRAVFSL